LRRKKGRHNLKKGKAEVEKKRKKKKGRHNLGTRKEGRI